MPSDETIGPPERTPPRAGAPRGVEWPGASVGPYRLVRLLGEGGFSTVWLAERRDPFVQQVAIKFIKAGMDSKEVLSRFEQERQALAVMNHPHVAKVLDGGITGQGRPYFAMELVRGEPINAFCDRHRLSIGDRLRLFVQVCEAVQHAHTKGIIHRDLKPSNVLVEMGDGDVPSAMVIDFGIAKAVSGRMTDRTVFTETGQMLGTPEYMSPEQAEPGAVDVDTRTDVYGLGVILYELLTGALPFSPDELRSRAYREIQRMIREEDPLTPSARFSTIASRDTALAARIAEARKDAPPALARMLRRELEWIPMKAMRKDRRERYLSATELAADVSNYLLGRPLAAGPESTWYRARKFGVRHRGALAAAAAVLLSLVAGLVVAVSQRDRAMRSEEAALAALRESEESRGRAEAAVGFIRKVLETSDPWEGGNRGTTVLQAMERARQRLDSPAPALDPLHAADVRSMIAKVLFGAGKYAEAEVEVRKALALREARLGPSDPLVAGTIHDLGTYLCSQGRPGEALPLLERAVRIAEGTKPPDGPLLVRILDSLGLLHEEAGRTREAAECYDRGISTLDAAGRPGDDELRAQLLMHRGLLLHDGSPEAAERDYRESARLFERIGPGESPSLAVCLENLAVLLEETGRAREAVALLDRVIRAQEAALGADHPAVASALFNRAVARRAVGELDAAIADTERALETWEGSLGGGSAETRDARLLLQELRSAPRPRTEPAPADGAP